MENTLKNRRRFLLHCYSDNQNSIKSIYGDGAVIGVIGIINNPDQYFADLKPLSAITDEDAIEIGKMCGLAMNVVGHKDADKIVLYDDSYKFFIMFVGYLWMQKNGFIYPQSTLKCYDYLRSKGYAIPYIGLSVETMVEYGWIKLTHQYHV